MTARRLKTNHYRHSGSQREHITTIASRKPDDSNEITPLGVPLLILPYSNARIVGFLRVDVIPARGSATRVSAQPIPVPPERAIDQRSTRNRPCGRSETAMSQSREHL